MPPADDQSWSESEYRPLIEAYMKMLRLEIAGEKYNKAAFRRELLAGPLKARSKRASEYKMCNVSSVLFDLRKRWIRGYKPLPHKQRHGGFIEAVTAAAQEHEIPRADL